MCIRQRRLGLRLAAWVGGVCCLLSVVCCACRVLVVVVGSELEVNILAFADLLEVGFLVSGDVVAKQVEGRQCPDGRCNISKGGTGDILDILALTCTLGWQQREL